jgi:two-component system, NtrC family, response regulator GlrR
MKSQQPLSLQPTGVDALPGVVGQSPQLLQAARQVPLIAKSDAPCLLLGETGTGKELFARAIHYLSSRSHNPFVPVNCGAIADHLFENELFGHTKGAYTDARSQESGLLDFAEGGTLFLDEVDSLSPSAQVKLLRVLQEGEYRPLGSARSLRTDVRIVAACNSDLWQILQNRRFREDLYHRLNVLRLVIPPLRDRENDIPLLAMHFVREFSSRYGRGTVCITAQAMERLTACRWSGNVRELQSVLHRAMLLHVGPSLEAAHLDLADFDLPDLDLQGLHLPKFDATNSDLPMLDLPGQASPRANSTLRAADAADQTLKAAKARAVNQFEQTYLSELLRSCGGNVSRAARAAGKERRSFQRLLRKHSVNSSTMPSRTTA